MGLGKEGRGVLLIRIKKNINLMKNGTLKRNDSKELKVNVMFDF